jgi:hypothetical protein
MKFLDVIKLGGNIAGSVLAGRPLFVPGTQGVDGLVPANTSNKIIAAITTVEQMAEDAEALKGTDKLSAAVKIASDGIEASTALMNTEVFDQDRYELGKRKIVDGWNDIIKSVRTKGSGETKESKPVKGKK